MQYVRWRDTDYRGRLAGDTESLIPVSRTGCRPHVTRRSIFGSIVADTMLTAALLAQAAVKG